MRATGRFTPEEVEMAKLLKAGKKTTDINVTVQEEEGFEESPEVRESAEVYEDVEDTNESESECPTNAE